MQVSQSTCGHKLSDCRQVLHHDAGDSLSSEDMGMMSLSLKINPSENNKGRYNETSFWVTRCINILSLISCLRRPSVKGNEMEPHFSVWYIRSSGSWHRTTFFIPILMQSFHQLLLELRSVYGSPEMGMFLAHLTTTKEANGSRVQVVANEERKGPRGQVIPDLGDHGGDF